MYHSQGRVAAVVGRGNTRVAHTLEASPATRRLTRDFLARKVAACCCAAALALTLAPASALAEPYNPTGIVDANQVAAVTGGAGGELSMCSVLEQLCDEAAQAQATRLSEALAASVEAQRNSVERVYAVRAQAVERQRARQKARGAVAVAKEQLGIPYVAGGNSPEVGFDCSGLTQYVYAQVGIALTHNAQAQFNETPSVSSDNLKVGDLVFFGSSTASITHVGIYVGRGRYLHAPQTGDVVSIDNLSERSNFVGATRPVK